MFRIGLIATIVLSSSYAVGDEVEENFKKAAATSGPEYVKLRDGLVQSAPDAFLKEKSTKGTLQERIVAIAVTGWKSNGKLYTEMMSARTSTSRFGNTYFEWALRPQGSNDQVVPLGMELLLKNTAGKTGQGSGQRVIGAAARKKFEHAELLIEYLSQTPIADVEAAKYTAQVLSALPAGAVSQEKVVATLEQLGKDEKNGRQVGAVLANSLLRSAVGLNPDDKEKLIDTLVSDDGLLKALGPETSLKIAGTIGSPKAVAALQKFLTETPEPEKHVWAFQLLRKTKDGSGTDVLQKYASDNANPEGGRLCALESLVTVKYSPSVGDTAKAILEDTKAPVRVRVEAIRTLDQLVRVHQNDNDIAAPLRDVILQSDFGSTDGTTEHKALVEAIKKGVRENAP